MSSVIYNCRKKTQNGSINPSRSCMDLSNERTAGEVQILEKGYRGEESHKRWFHRILRTKFTIQLKDSIFIRGIWRTFHKNLPKG